MFNKKNVTLCPLINYNPIYKSSQTFITSCIKKYKELNKLQDIHIQFPFHCNLNELSRLLINNLMTDN